MVFTFIYVVNLYDENITLEQTLLRIRAIDAGKGTLGEPAAAHKVHTAEEANADTKPP